MAINASVDGTTYEGINKITAGGKTINLVYRDDGESVLPASVAEIAEGSYTQETDSGVTKTFMHGLSSTPDIIVMWSDFKTRYTSESKPANTTIVGAVWNNAGGFKAYTSVSTSYTGGDNSTSPVAGTPGSENDGFITNVGDTSFDVLFKSNRRLGGGLTYKWLAIRLV